jgi:hypothetical protein
MTSQHRRAPARKTSDAEMEVVMSIEETTPGSDLDELLRREQTEAILELIAAHVAAQSRVHIAPRNMQNEETPD